MHSIRAQIRDPDFRQKLQESQLKRFGDPELIENIYQREHFTIHFA